MKRLARAEGGRGVLPRASLLNHSRSCVHPTALASNRALRSSCRWGRLHVDTALGASTTTRYLSFAFSASLILAPRVSLRCSGLVRGDDHDMTARSNVVVARYEAATSLGVCQAHGEFGETGAQASAETSRRAHARLFAAGGLRGLIRSCHVGGSRDYTGTGRGMEWRLMHAGSKPTKNLAATMTCCVS